MDAMVADHERSTGPWEIEWIVLPEAFCLMAGALKQSRFVLEGLEVDAAAMRRNIDMTHGLVMSEAVMMGLGPYIGRADRQGLHRIHAGDKSMKTGKLIKLLYVQVLIGLIVGIAVGHYWPEFGAALKPLGDGFVKLVKMMIAPVVFCTIVSGITSLGDSKEIGKTLLKAMALFYALTILALATGLVTVLLIQPGAGMHIDPKNLDASVATRFANQVHIHGFTDFVMHIIPNAFVGAFAEGEVLPVLLLAVLCGFGLTKIGTAAKPVLEGIEGFSHMLFAAFGIIMRLAPIGAFGAMAFTVGRYGIKSIGSLGLLIGTFYVACIFFVVVVLGLLARAHRFKLWQLLRYIREELLVVLGTSSSEPVLPRLLMKLERLGCKKGVVGLVLPTGYSFNLDGTAIYLTLASLFIA